MERTHSKHYFYDIVIFGDRDVLKHLNSDKAYSQWPFNAIDTQFSFHLLRCFIFSFAVPIYFI